MTLAPNNSNLFAAAQLARAAGMSKRACVSALRGVQARGTLVVNGNPAPAWSMGDLPQGMQDEILRRASLFGHASAQAYIADAPAPWQPPVPLNLIADEAVTKAARMRSALARAIGHRESGVSSQTLEAMVMEDYQSEFGHSITDRTARTLLRRTVERDNFAENWNRLEIYLDGNAPRKAAPAPAFDGSIALEFAEIHDVLATFKSATQPSPRERETLWVTAVKIFQRQLAAGADHDRARRNIVAYLWRAAGWLARSENALRMAFERKNDRWVKSEGQESALRDGRAAKRGIAKVPRTDPDTLLDIATTAVFGHGGRARPAAREWAEALEIDDELAGVLADLQGDRETAPQPEPMPQGERMGELGEVEMVPAADHETTIPTAGRLNLVEVDTFSHA